MRPRIEQPYTRLFLSSIMKSPCPASDLAIEYSISLRNTRPYLQILHEQKSIYICSYIKKLQGPAVPVYAYNKGGEFEDIEYPKPLTGAESMARRRLIKRAAIAAFL